MLDNNKWKNKNNFSRHPHLCDVEAPLTSKCFSLLLTSRQLTDLTPSVQTNRHPESQQATSSTMPAHSLPSSFTINKAQLVTITTKALTRRAFCTNTIVTVSRQSNSQPNWRRVTQTKWRKFLDKKLKRPIKKSVRTSKNSKNRPNCQDNRQSTEIALNMRQEPSRGKCSLRDWTFMGLIKQGETGVINSSTPQMSNSIRLSTSTKKPWPCRTKTIGHLS